MNILDNVAKFLATQLDKLKVANPIVFVFVQASLGIFLGLFANDTINIPTPEVVTKVLAFIGTTDLDNLVIVLLGAVIALVGPRTTLLKNGSIEDTTDKP